MGNQWHFDADTYLAMVRQEIADDDELQQLLAAATGHVDAQRILDLGAGTGVTAAAVQALHPDADLLDVDASDQIDRPSTLADQLDWLRAAGLDPSVVLDRGDRVVVAADRRRPEEMAG